MRFTHIFFTFTLLLLCSCSKEEPAPQVNLKRFKVDNAVRCTYHEQNIQISFSLEEDDVEVSVSKNVEWATNLTLLPKNIISADIAENDGAERVATITLSAPGYADAEVSVKQNGAPTSLASHTLMFYFFGTSLNSYFSTNIADAKLAIESGALGKDCRVVFFRQRNKSEGYLGELCYDKDSGKCFESLIEDNIIIEGERISSQYISKIINKMADAAPAQRYGMVMAGHGRAWLPKDSSRAYTSSLWQSLFVPAPGAEVTRHFGENNVQVNMSDIANGISDSAIDMDYILFDACFMSNIEALYELRNSANYIIASPCEIMGRGFPYERTLPHLFKDNGAYTDYSGAAESYYLYYRDEYYSNSRCGSIAVYDCSEIESLKDATIEVVKSSLEEYDKSYLQTYEGQPQHYFYDFGQWVNSVATDSAALEAFNTQLNKTVITKYTLDTFYTAFGSYGSMPINVDVYSGVTTSAPSEILESLWIETEWYKEVWQL